MSKDEIQLGETLGIEKVSGGQKEPVKQKVYPEGDPIKQVEVKLRHKIMGWGILAALMAETVILTETKTQQIEKRFAETVALAESIAYAYHKRLEETVVLTENLALTTISGSSGGTKLSINIGIRLCIFLEGCFGTQTIPFLR